MKNIKGFVVFVLIAFMFLSIGALVVRAENAKMATSGKSWLEQLIGKDVVGRSGASNGVFEGKLMNVEQYGIVLAKPLSQTEYFVGYGQIAFLQEKKN